MSTHIPGLYAVEPAKSIIRPGSACRTLSRKYGPIGRVESEHYRDTEPGG